MIRRIFADNFNSLSELGGTIDLRLPTDSLVLDSVFPPDYGDDVINFLSNIFNNFLRHYNWTYEIIPYTNEEAITIMLDADIFSYTKILAPNGKTVIMEEFLDKDTQTTYSRGIDEESSAAADTYKPFLMLRNALGFDSHYTFQILGKGDCKFNGGPGGNIYKEDKEVVDLCNKIIPHIFPGIISVGPKGEATHETKDGNQHTFSKDVEGGGYNQVLDIIKGLYMVINTNSIVVFRNWSNHLHPILKGWFIKLFKDLDQKKKYKGTLLVNNYSLD